MSVPSRLAPGRRTPDLTSEQKLIEIRREAERRGEVKASGIRPAGSPFPIASPDTGYYGIPLLKKPAWTWEIPLYFSGGAPAEAASGVGGIAASTAPVGRRWALRLGIPTAAPEILTPCLLAEVGRRVRICN